jgi:hypothetical protein
MAPPPGRVMATLVEDWHTTAAWASVRPGMAATSMGQYVTTFHTVRRTRIAYSAADMVRMVCHTRSRSAMRGSTPTKTPMTMAGNNRARRTRRTFMIRPRRRSSIPPPRVSPAVGI